MNKFTPLVSIIIPVYNGENYLKQAIDSALAQTYKNIEIIVANDGSSDETEEICLSYGNKIRYFAKENGGVSTALNLAIKKMKGEYFSWLSHDDLYYPEKIERQIKFWQEKKLNKKTILFNDFEAVDQVGRHLYYRKFGHRYESEKPEWALLKGMINGITLLIPKEAFINNLFDEKLKATQDYDLWLKMQNNGFTFYHLDEVLTKTRIHPLQESNNYDLVLEEGNQLWIKLVSAIDDKRKKQLAGSIFEYYYQMAIFLQDSPYKKAMLDCIQKCKAIDKKSYKQKKIKYSSKLDNAFGYLRKNGLQSTIEKSFNQGIRYIDKLFNTIKLNCRHKNWFIKLKNVHHWALTKIILTKRISLLGNKIKLIIGEEQIKPIKKVSARISIIILNYNNLKVLLKAIPKLIENNDYNYEIIIVDNKSLDNSAKILKDKFTGKIKLVYNAINGCASGRNLGAKHAQGDYLFFLDSDQWPLEKKWLDKYIFILKNFKEVKAVGSHAGFITEKNDLSGPTLCLYKDDGLPKSHLFRTNIDYIGTGAMMIKKSNFETLAGFDEKYDPFSFEDTDFSRKIIKSGGKIAYFPNKKIYHVNHATTKATEDKSSDYQKIFLRNANYFKSKWLNY